MKNVLNHISKHKRIYLGVIAIIGILLILFVPIHGGNRIYGYIDMLVHEPNYKPLWDFVAIASFSMIFFFLYPIVSDKSFTVTFGIIHFGFLIYYFIKCVSFKGYPEPINWYFVICYVLLITLANCISYSDKIAKIRLQHKPSKQNQIDKLKKETEELKEQIKELKKTGD